VDKNFLCVVCKTLLACITFYEYYAYYAINLCLNDSYVYLSCMFMKYYDICGYASLFMLS
jgi:hypothetical protein